MNRAQQTDRDPAFAAPPGYATGIDAAMDWFARERQSVRPYVSEVCVALGICPSATIGEMVMTAGEAMRAEIIRLRAENASIRDELTAAWMAGFERGKSHNDKLTDEPASVTKQTKGN